MRRLLAYRDARLLVAGQSLSAFGDWAMWIVLAVWMKTLTGLERPRGARLLRSRPREPRRPVGRAARRPRQAAPPDDRVRLRPGGVGSRAPLRERREHCVAPLPRRVAVRSGRLGLLPRALGAPSPDAARGAARRGERPPVLGAAGSTDRRAACRCGPLRRVRRRGRGDSRRGNVRRIRPLPLADARPRGEARAPRAPLPARGDGGDRARLADVAAAPDDHRDDDRAPRGRLHRDAHLHRDRPPRPQAVLLRCARDAAGHRLDRRRAHGGVGAAPHRRGAYRGARSRAFRRLRLAARRSLAPRSSSSASSSPESGSSGPSSPSTRRSRRARRS